MEDSIRAFPEQFAYEPVIENEDALKPRSRFIVCGMGGSHLSAGLARRFLPETDIIQHRDYGLPLSGSRLSEYLVILSSYSGNTEEVLDALEVAREKNAAVAAVTTGGELLERAQKYGIPYIKMPNTGIQPRTALGFSFRALLALMDEHELLEETSALNDTLAPTELSEHGAMIAQVLEGFVPLVYASAKNEPLAYNWKIKLNETGKIPAFYNVFPELNHNEMNGFDITEETEKLGKPFYFIFLKDMDDHPRIEKRMDVLEAQLAERGLPVKTLMLEGKTAPERIFSSLLLADWTALSLARVYNREPEAVPMIEDFKKRIKS